MSADHSADDVGRHLLGDAHRTQRDAAELQGWLPRLTIPLVIWLVGWPVYYTLWPKRAPRPASGT